MGRLIDADVLKDKVKLILNGNKRMKAYAIYAEIETAQTMDAVQVVRCGDCRYIRPTGINGLYECVRMQLATKKDEFCSRGERKGDGVWIVRHIDGKMSQ